MKIIKICSVLLGVLLSYSLSAANDPALDAELKWLRAERLIEVVSKQKEDKNTAAGIVSIVSRDDIERYGGNNLFEVLNRVTSLYMLSSFFWSNGIASSRGDLFGAINNHTLVLMNGRPIREGYNGGLNETLFRDFPIHQIEQIEVIRGSGSVLYGSNAFTGVINIVTKKAKRDSLTLRGRYGSFNTGQGEGEFTWKNDQDTASAAGAVRYRTSDGWLFSAVGEDKKVGGFRNDDNDVSATLSAEWQDMTLNAFVVNNRHNKWGTPPAGAGQLIENNRLFFDAGYKKPLNSHWLSQWNLTYNRINFASIRSNTQPGLTERTEDSVLFEQTQFFNFFEHKLNALIGGLIEWQTGRGITNNAPDILSRYQHLRSSLYGEINYALLKNLKLTMGGQWNRFEHLENAPLTATSPDIPNNGLVGRLGLVYEINPTLGVKLLYSQAFRSPSAIELENTDTPLGTRNLRPERIETADVQVFYHDNDYQVSLTAFRSRLSNLISRYLYNTTPVQYRFFNQDSAILEGIEFESDAKISETLQWKGSYTFQTNHTNQQNNATLVPNHAVKIGLSYDINYDLQLSVFDTFYSRAKAAPTAAIVNPTAGNYHNLTVNLNYQMGQLFGLPRHKKVLFTLYLDNLLNESIYYPEVNRKIINTIPGSPGRTVFGELTLAF